MAPAIVVRRVTVTGWTVIIVPAIIARPLPAFQTA
jgi:hypothetical protein